MNYEIEVFEICIPDYLHICMGPALIRVRNHELYRTPTTVFCNIPSQIRLCNLARCQIPLRVEAV